jgi:hypothetical protein
MVKMDILMIFAFLVIGVGCFVLGSTYMLRVVQKRMWVVDLKCPECGHGERKIRTLSFEAYSGEQNEV